MGKDENFFKESQQKIAEYIQDRLMLVKLDIVERGSKLVATMFTILVIALFSFFVLLFLSVMAAYMFGEMLHQIFWGFGIVAGIYILLLVLIIMFRKKFIQKQIIDIIIGIVFEKANEEIKEEIKEEANGQ
jgi:hypothetical protein